METYHWCFFGTADKRKIMLYVSSPSGYEKGHVLCVFSLSNLKIGKRNREIILGSYLESSTCSLVWKLFHLFCLVSILHMGTTKLVILFIVC